MYQGVYEGALTGTVEPGGTNVVLSFERPEVTTTEGSNAEIFMYEGIDGIGGTITIPVRIINHPGIQSFSLSVQYDSSVIELIGLKSTLNLVHSEPMNTVPFNMNWIGDTITGDFSVAELQFRVRAESGILSPVTVYGKAAGGNLEQPQSVPLITAMVYASVMNQKEGDMNGDGEIDIFDLVAVKRLIVNDTYEVMADLNSDKVVDIFDLLALQKLILAAIS